MFQHYIVLPLIFAAAVLLPYKFYEIFLFGLLFDLIYFTGWPIYLSVAIIIFVLSDILHTRISIHV